MTTATSKSPREQALDRLAGLHHSSVSPETAREILDDIDPGLPTLEGFVEGITEAFEHNPAKAQWLAPKELTSENADEANLFGCTICGYRWGKAPEGYEPTHGEPRFCASCGKPLAEEGTMYHVYETGEKVPLVYGLMMSERLCRALDLEPASFMGRGFQHRENLKCLREHFGLMGGDGDA